MAGVINTGSIPKSLFPGVKGWWGRGYAEKEQEWPELFDTVSSDKNYEEYVGATGFGLVPVKPEGASTLYDSETQGPVVRISNVSYALGYIVTREEMDDNQYEKLANQRARALGFSFRQTKENVAANVYNRAFNSAYTGADGVALLSASHPGPLGGTFSNKLGVDARLSVAALEDLVIQIGRATEYRGLLIGIKPRKLIVPWAEFFNAQRIFGSDRQAYSSTNDINVLKKQNVFPDGMAVNHYLSSPHAFFIRTDVAGPGMIHQKRIAIEFSQDNEFDTENMKYKGYERYGFGWADPLALFGSNGP